MSAGHTPTPWLHDPYGSIRDTRGEMVAVNGASWVCSQGESQKVAKANSRFVVRAVNAHDDLVEALQRADSALQAVTSGASCSYQTDDGKFHSIEADDGERCDIIHSDITCECESAQAIVRAALSKALTTGDEA